MRITLLTLAILVAGSADGAVLLWTLALMPAAGALMFVGFLLRPARRRRVQRDDRQWRGVHRYARRPSPPGRHAPARGERLKGLSRQAQLEERTVSVDRAALLSDAQRLREDTERWAAVAHEHKPYRDGVRIRCQTCRLDIEQPEGMPEIGAHGFQSWR